MLDEITKDNNTKMDRSIEALLSDFKTVRTGRASLSLLDNILVDSYGSKMPVNQLSTLSIPEPRAIVIEPWDKSVMKAIEKAIHKSDLDINPVNDGKVLRLNFPPLTEEKRMEFVKQVKHKGENAKISIRNIRRESNEKIKANEKEGHIGEDDVRHVLDIIQKSTDGYIAKIDQLTNKKEKEIMEI